MRIPISEARRQLPKLVRQVQKDPALRVEIMVRDEPVAELRAIEPAPVAGQAARKLEALRRRLATHKPRPRTDISSRVKDYLYGPESTEP